MVQQLPLTSHPSPWTSPDLLVGLLDYFREQGFKVATDEYALAQDLVLALIARGEDVSNVAKLKTYLAPVLCTNAREQSTFSAHFDRWYAQVCSTVIENHQHRQPERELEISGNRWNKWKWILAVVAVLVATGLLGLFWNSQKIASGGLSRDPHGPAVPAQGPTQLTTPELSLGILLYAGLVVTLTLLAWASWWYFRGRLFLKRRSTAEATDVISVTLASRTEDWLDQGFLRRTARELRRRYPVPSADLATELTVERTIRNNGQFAPVFSSRLASPEYLVLIDRQSTRDHHAHQISELIERLEAEQVYIEQYYFDQDPRTVFSVVADVPPLTLHDLVVRYPNFRTLIFSDCAVFFNTVSGELEGWVDILRQWRHVAVFTTKLRSTWGYQENLLSRKWLILPTTLDGIDEFARFINGLQSRHTADQMESGPFPLELMERPNRWLEQDSPPLEVMEDVLQSVRRFLGEDGYFWFSSCAAYPEIHFNLTLYLGMNINNLTGERLSRGERAANLFRLPWFRKAYMPDWLRLQLVRDLTRQQNANVREALNRLWLSAAGGTNRAINLEIARRHPFALIALTRSVFSKLLPRTAPGGPLHDRVFASVMLGLNVDPLAVRIPRMWRKFLTKRKGTSQVTWAEKTANGFLAVGFLVGTFIFTGLEMPPWVVFVSVALIITGGVLAIRASACLGQTTRPR
jgi:hypothetical protein